MNGAEIIDMPKRSGRASMSFSKAECQWLCQLMLLVMTKSRPELSHLRDHALAPEISRKVLRLLEAAKADAEKPRGRRGHKEPKKPARGRAEAMIAALHAVGSEVAL